jgi:hypothetical protein
VGGGPLNRRVEEREFLARHPIDGYGGKRLDTSILLAPLGAILGAFIGAYFATWFRERRVVKRKHFHRLKQRILDPWLSRLSEAFTVCSFQHNISAQHGSPMSTVPRWLGLEKDPLFEDLQNHLTELMQEWSEFVRELEEHDKVCLNFAIDLKDRFEDKTGLQVSDRFEGTGIILHSLVNMLYLRLLLDVGANHTKVDEAFRIEESGGAFMLGIPGQSYARGTKEQMQKLEEAYFELAQLPENKDKARTIVTNSKHLSEAIDRIRFELRRIIESNRLEGNCAFLKF